MEFQHTSVLFHESIKSLNIKEDGIYLDGTLGGGGHASGICARLAEEGLLIAVDRDIEAIQASRKVLEQYPCKKIFVHDNYGRVKKILEDLQIEKIDGALLDLGVSSYQLDNAERGFSYMHDAPLDMRMNSNDTFTAKNIVNEYSKEDIKDIIRRYGEEKWAARIADFIVKERSQKEIERTGQLVDIIKRAIPAAARREGPHPAKRTFQALRIEVNNELGVLENAVEDFIDVLGHGGRLAVITFHSLEDRIVKQIFNEAAQKCTCPLEIPMCVCGGQAKVKKISTKPISAGRDELDSNPRSRSAKLRVIEKIEVL